MNDRSTGSGRSANRPTSGRGILARSSPEDRRSLDERLRLWLLGGVMGLYVARTLMPNDTTAAETGSGMPFVMLWLLLALVWVLGAVVSRRMAWRGNWADAAALALFGCIGVSSLLALRTEAPRPTLNMLWEWAGLGLGYFLLRQLLRTERETRAVLAVMLALAVGHSLYAYYQYHVTIPATKAEYRRDPEASIQAAGIQAPPGSAERKQFEDRLLYSSEPFSTFTLTNSLAGYLAPWLVVGMGIVVSSRNGACGKPRTVWLIGLALAAVAGCLYLTKSRSGCLAAGCGAALLLAAMLRNRLKDRLGKRHLVGIAITTAVMIAVVAAAGSRSEVIAQAKRSLSYRSEYWQATSRMIADHPLWGVGAGNFGDWYTLYKLPQAKEEIKDPHSFLFEVWSSSGTFAATALLAFLSVVLLTACRATFGAPPATDLAAVRPLCDRLADRLFLPNGPNEPRGAAGSDAARHIQFGGLCGLLIAPSAALTGFDGPELAAVVCVAPATAISLWLLTDWVRAGRLSTLIPVAGVVTLLVNLLAAGGIAFPAVAGTLWILAAVAVTQREGFRQSRLLPKAASAGAVFALIVLTLACQQTGVGPVLAAQRALTDAETAASIGNPHRARAALEAAVAADPWSPLPWRYLSQLTVGQWSTGNGPRDLALFERAAEQQLRLCPHSNMAWMEVGLAYLEAYRRFDRRDFAQQAVRHLRRTVELYPTSAIRRAHLALALRAAGEETAADEQAALAIRLHDGTDHPEKKLSPELLEQLQRTP